MCMDTETGLTRKRDKYRQVRAGYEGSLKQTERAIERLGMFDPSKVSAAKRLKEKILRRMSKRLGWGEGE